MQKQLFYSLSPKTLKSFLIENGQKPFVANQILQWVYEKHEYTPEGWSNISKNLKELLEENFDFTLPKIVWNGLSKDGTRKFLVAMRDGKTVETVMIPARSNRKTLCVSSQVGCAIGCTFCHTGTMGLMRHLEAGEIIGQFLAVTKFLREKVGPEERLSNVVFMGQGEPLHNFEQVKAATELMVDEKALGLSQRRVTISTSGLVPAIKKLEEFPSVNIAISLHAAHNEIRTELMPINKAYDLDRLLTAIKEIPLKAHRYITYEYLLIDQYNDRAEDVEALLKLLPKKVSKVNLIPFNEYPESNFKRPSVSRINWFKNQLDNGGVTTTIRTTKGSDILAACGQLKSELEKDLNLWK
ncbi:23S rRNA (adenine(2503)-C(2))-methyltransferase [Bacteriovorax sp. BAL6_X]|uniref:23S rRNA (adenine(2503)-C(2))-methyltransferase RlmN n=1 Tax=Bacteriovorax sp. BAL6_X TaxID=1201290 RepID=UPI000385CBAA|nr:23S rRNA (adenine(2503)-C(2))-methyltransferase RlmN [Bacteriovorax sp. BAL6_X]EPZ51725.1 23S rRNA (adenine(2503)-C(2))-methyltransferase [Bacteriovorax sp. BAL6_X]